ncbi:MAG: Ig-like domain-containing protein [Planctomycetes bacterium]|nr:Ig-like domain-containing protein [Planctomycetota bacterium]
MHQPQLRAHPALVGVVAFALAFPACKKNSTPVDDPAVRAGDATLLAITPVDGERGLAARREIELRFAGALTPASVHGAAIVVETGGVPWPTRFLLGARRDTVTVFPLDPWPANAELAVVVVDGLLRGDSGRAVDGDRDGRVGGGARQTFAVADRTRVPGSELCGRVFAADPQDPAQELPLAGATVAVDGLESECFAITDALGSFCLTEVPVGDVLVHVRGGTAAAPTGFVWADTTVRWRGVAGRRQLVDTVWLPAVDAAAAPVSPAAPTTIGVTEAQLARTADPVLREELRRASLVVPANALVGDDGERGGRVALVPVPLSRLPQSDPTMPSLPLVVAVTSDGAANFDSPAALCLPNLADPVAGRPLPAGARSALWHRDEDTATWRIVGTMTVASDGLTVCADAGVGVREVGLYGAAPATMGFGQPDRIAGGSFWSAVWSSTTLSARRGRVDGSGTFVAPLPAEATVLHARFDATSRRYGEVTLTTAPVGEVTWLPFPAWQPLAGLADVDSDQLPDVVEACIGTDPGNADTDDDGEQDGDEVFAGRDPVDGLADEPQLLADVATAGPALDLDANDGGVFVACDDRGVQRFHARDGQSPLPIGTVALAGRTTRLAVAGSTVAAAAGTGGLAVIDWTSLAAPVTSTLAVGDTTAVAISDGHVFAGTAAGRLLVVEAGRATILAERQLGTPIRDLLWLPPFVAVLTPTSLLMVELDGVTLTPRQPLALPSTTMRRLVGVGVRALGVDDAGFTVIDFTVPASPQVVRQFVSGASGWRDLALDGVGNALAVVGPTATPGPADDLLHYRLPDLSQPPAFVRTFEGSWFPGLAELPLAAVAVHAGLVWAGSADGRLVCLRHVPADRQGRAPSIALTTPNAQGSIEQGRLLTVVAEVGDDRAVASVEFELAGQLAFVDTGAPFIWNVLAPSPTVTPTLRIGARARDLGGNVGTATPIAVTVVTDQTPPRLLRTTPGADDLVLARRELTITALFDEALDPGSIQVGNALLVASGPDAQFGTGDDVPVVMVSASLDAAGRTATWTANTPLAPQRHRVDLAGVRDRAGNAMAAHRFEFRTADGLLVSFYGEHGLGDVDAMFVGATPLQVVERRAGALPRQIVRTVVPNVHFPLVSGTWALHAGPDGLLQTTDFANPGGDDVTWELPDSFGMLLEGRIEPPLPGAVTFQCLVDDAFALDLGGQRAFEHLGCQVSTSYTSAALPFAGRTAFRMAAADACDFGFALTLSANGGGFAGGIVPPSVFR